MSCLGVLLCFFGWLVGQVDRRGLALAQEILATHGQLASSKVKRWTLDKVFWILGVCF